MTRYALLAYDSENLGDEIQSIAIEQFLPSVDLLVDRDRMNRLPEGSEGRYKIVLNGWHTHLPQNWPPSPALDPLLISIHLTNEIVPSNTTGRRPVEALLEGDSLAFFRSAGPIGCRDTWTQAKLREKNIEAYFSACATLTLGSGMPLARQDYVCAVDLPGPTLGELRRRTHSRIAVATHACRTIAPYAMRASRARRLLSLYAHARCVVTSRLHCALPCLALGTPVLFVADAADFYRFDGLFQLLRHCRPEEFATARFDVDDPSDNPDAYKHFRERLVRQINQFVDPSAPQDLIKNPFVPETTTDALIESEEVLVLKEDKLVQYLKERSRSGHSRRDFIYALAEFHRTIGDTAEAERLTDYLNSDANHV